MHWESWTVSSIPAEPSLKSPGVLQVGHLAHMQRSSLTVVEPAKKPESLAMKAPRGIQ